MRGRADFVPRRVSSAVTSASESLERRSSSEMESGMRRSPGLFVSIQAFILARCLFFWRM